MGFSRQEYWSGLPFPPPGDLPDPGIEPASPVSPALQADSFPLNHWGSPFIWCGLMYTHTHTPFQILFPCRLWQNIEYTLRTLFRPLSFFSSSSPISISLYFFWAFKTAPHDFHGSHIWTLLWRVLCPGSHWLRVCSVFRAVWCPHWAETTEVSGGENSKTKYGHFC